MIKAQDAREITMMNSTYIKHLSHYQKLVEMLIEEAALKGQNNCILDIKSKYSYEISVIIGEMLISYGYTIRMFKDRNYGLWIFW